MVVTTLKCLLSLSSISYEKLFGLFPFGLFPSSWYMHPSLTDQCVIILTDTCIHSKNHTCLLEGHPKLSLVQNNLITRRTKITTSFHSNVIVHCNFVAFMYL